MIIFQIRSHEPFQVPLVEHNNVLEQLAAQRADHAFDVGRLPQAARRDAEFLNAHNSLQPNAPMFAVDAIVVIDEASAGDPAEVRKRLAVIGGLLALEITEDAEALTQAILSEGILPPQAVRDGAHVAVAAIHAIDYLLTWNCKHLANAQIARRIASVCTQLGHRMPIICTPEELMGA